MELVPLPEADDIARHFRRAVVDAKRFDAPYPRWYLEDVLPKEVCLAVMCLPLAPPKIEKDNPGVRDENNSERAFFAPRLRSQFTVCDLLAQTFQRADVAGLLARTCGFAAQGSFLRVEYMQDVDGAWLQPHCDVPAKLFSMVVNLFTGPDTKEWGTDIYDDKMTVVDKAPSTFNSGSMFVPGQNTWHGVAKRKIIGIRRLIQVNYCRPQWRDRDQLAFPDQPITLKHS